MEYTFSQKMIRALVRWGLLRRVAYPSSELSKWMNESLPQTYPLSVPIGSGEVIVDQAKLFLPKREPHLMMKLGVTITADALNQRIYQAHIEVRLKGVPVYESETKTIRFQQLKAEEARLIRDKFLLISDGKRLVRSFTPAMIRGLVASTLETTIGLVNGVMPRPFQQYLDLYVSGGVEQVFNFHRPEIERMLVEHIEAGDFHYTLNEDDFDEALFIEFGRKIAVDDGMMEFYFSGRR